MSQRSSWVLGVFGTVACGAAFVACASSTRPFEGSDVDLPSRDAGASDATQVGFGEGGPGDAEAPYVLSTEPVDVIFTADNAYAFGWGNATSLKSYKSRPNTFVAGDIFNCPVIAEGATCSAANGCGPESYVVPADDAPSNAYLYVVAWSDEVTTQGALGQFKRGTADALYTGDESWEVCATGVQHNPTDSSDPGPSKADVEAKIALCTAGSSSVVSKGWVDKNGPVTANAVGMLAVGEDNSDPTGNFRIACQQNADGTPGIDAAAQWMWYQPAGFSSEQAFTSNTGNATGTYLIFRVKAKDIPVPPVK